MTTTQTASRRRSTAETHDAAAPAGQTLPGDRTTTGAQASLVAGDHTSDSGHGASVSLGQCAAVGADRNGSVATIIGSSPTETSSLADPFLALAADILDDAERNLIANQNRLRQLTRTGVDSDGEERGFGLTADHPDVRRLSDIVALLEQVTKDATKNLEKMLRRHPLAPFIKAQRGVGDKQAARLLAAIGDPYWNTLHDRPRTVSELWAYCGLHTLPATIAPPIARETSSPGTSAAGDDHHHSVTQGNAVAARRRKGQRANWSTNAKTRAWLIIESCMKQLDPACKTETGVADHQAGCDCSPYRIAVDRRRLHTAATHPDWTPKHSQLDGMRIASKELLRDLWAEARRLHEGISDD